MKRLIAGVALGGATAAMAAAAFPVTLIDDGGARVGIPRAPRRVVSLTPGNTEMLFAIGAGPRVVGDTVACDYPPAAVKIAKIGGYQPNYERIVALRPDLVVADTVAQSTAADRLRGLHETVLAIRPTTVALVEADLKLLGQATGNEVGAAGTVAAMEHELDEAARLAMADPARPRVLAVVGHDPLYVAGGATFMDDAIRRAGGTNVAAHIRGYAEYSAEAALADAPDIILVGDPGDRDALRKMPALRTVPAIRMRAVVMIDPNLLDRPGPRLADGVLALARVLHPSEMAKSTSAQSSRRGTRQDLSRSWKAPQ
ncbi:MAG: ABC transporter substrate-binding protein [Capsulimonadaceae bacterium]